MSLSRRNFIGTALAGAAISGRAWAAATDSLHVFRSPSCGCCGAWIEHMRRAGFAVTNTEIDDLDPVKARLGVPEDLQSCHTATIGGYVVEGHVPAGDVKRLLTERPKAIGIAVPGMPVGSPGMEQGSRHEPYRVILFGGAQRTIFARY